MENFSSLQIKRFMGKVYFFDKCLYSQIGHSLHSLMNIQAMLEEVHDEIIKAYLLTQKGAVINDILRFTKRTEYPDYPAMEEKIID